MIAHNQHIYLDKLFKTYQEELSELKKQFTGLEGDLRRAVDFENLQTNKMNKASTDLDTISKKLGDLVSKTRFSNDQTCTKDTRVKILQDIEDWIGGNCVGIDHDLFWLYGMAGCGKSAISHTISSRLDAQKMLGACFFCKRDDPNLNKPNKVLPSIAYMLAETVPQYRQSLVANLEQKISLTNDTSISEQYDLLFAFTETAVFKQTKYIVIDALDECGDRLTRATLIQQLVKVSKLNWLRLILTSRLESDISSAFTSSGITGTDLFEYEVNQDIATYLASLKAGPIKLSSDECQQLVDASCGLFIWISTVVKLLQKGRQPKKYLSQILAKKGTTHSSAVENLSNMYLTVLHVAIRDEDDKQIIRTVLAVIYEASLYSPIPLGALSKILPDIDSDLLHDIVNDLSSVIYKDEDDHNALRVYHPSFLDFIGDKSRCQEFWVDKHVISAELAKGCLKFMQCNLKFNICELESSYTKNQDIADLGDRVRNKISVELKYICYNWVHFISGYISHEPAEIAQSHGGNDLVDLLVEFLTTPQCLFWIEIFSLTSQVQLLCNLIGDLQDSVKKVCTQIVWFSVLDS